MGTSLRTTERNQGIKNAPDGESVVEVENEKKLEVTSFLG
jgi:Mor family transcriptional regulator